MYSGRSRIQRPPLRALQRSRFAFHYYYSDSAQQNRIAALKLLSHFRLLESEKWYRGRAKQVVQCMRQPKLLKLLQLSSAVSFFKPLVWFVGQLQVYHVAGTVRAHAPPDRSHYQAHVSNTTC